MIYKIEEILEAVNEISEIKNDKVKKSVEQSKPIQKKSHAINSLFHYAPRVGHVILLRVVPQNAQNGLLGSRLR